MTDSFKKFFASLVVAVMVMGCTGLNLKDTENYDISVCIPAKDETPEVCGKVGQLPLPVGSQPIATIVAIIVTPYLEDAFNVKNCDFAPATDAILSANCGLNGKPIRIKLAPEA